MLYVSYMSIGECEELADPKPPVVENLELMVLINGENYYLTLEVQDAIHGTLLLSKATSRNFPIVNTTFEL